MAEVRVQRAGLLTTIQDLGRWGFQSRGVGVAGPMDPHSHRLANALVENRRDAALLEITLTGPALAFDDDRRVAVTGGEFELILDGRRVSMNQCLTVRRGSRLSFGRRLMGARAYLAVHGGIDVPPLLGSRSTDVARALGGFEGRAVTAGDRLPLGLLGLRNAARHPRVAPPPLPQGRARLRVLPAPQTDRFEGEPLRILQSSVYTVGVASDRMGFRLEGPRLDVPGRADMLSDATTMGSIQVPPSGLPILLMADRQTTGGYPKIAAVISADLGLAAQLAPGDTLSFAMCSPREALAALIARERALLTIERGEAM